MDYPLEWSIYINRTHNHILGNKFAWIFDCDVYYIRIIWRTVKRATDAKSLRRQFGRIYQPPVFDVISRYWPFNSIMAEMLDNTDLTKTSELSLYFDIKKYFLYKAYMGGKLSKPTGGSALAIKQLPVVFGLERNLEIWKVIWNGFGTFQMTFGRHPIMTLK